MRKVASLGAVTAAAVIVLSASLVGARMLSFSEELGAEAAQEQAQSQAQAQSGPADFTLKDLNGDTVKLSQWRGHPVVVDFWATWCAPCREQIPQLEKLYDKYHTSRGLMIVGVACDTVQGEGAKVVPPFVKQLAINYPILLANDGVLEQFDVMALPTTLFITPDGKVAGRLRGAGPTDELSQAVERLLAQSGEKPLPAKPKKDSDKGKWVTLSYAP